MNDTSDSYSLFDNFKFVFSKIGKKRIGLTLNLAIYTISKASQIFLSAITVQLLLDLLLQSETQKNALFTILMLGTGVFIVSISEDISWNLYWPNVVEIRFQFLSMLGKKSMMLDYPSTENIEQLKKLELARAASSDNKRGFAGILINLSKMAAAFSSVAMCVIIMTKIAPITIIPSLICSFVNHYFLKNYKKIEFKNNYIISEDVERKKEVFNSSFWNFKYGKEIRVFDFSSILLGHFRDILNQHELLFSKIEDSKFKNNFDSKISIFVFESLSYAFVLWRVIGNVISVAEFITIIGVFDKVLLCSEELLTTLSDIKNNSQEISCFRSFIDSKQQSEQISKYSPPQTFHSLEFDHVSFRYPGAKHDAIKDFSFSVHSGEHIALIGVNGSGKSTILKLIMRLYSPSKGKILINGQNIQDFNLLEYYSLFSTMFQDAQVYSFSIAENIAMSSVIDKEKMRLCMNLSGFTEVVQKFPAKEETMLLKIVDDSGVELSGGEVQKLAFARAIYKNAPIVLLDEPTAALDAFSERKMFDAIHSFTENRTSIVVTHKLSSLKDYDKIIYIEMGELKEIGSHQELLSAQGRYAKLFHKQSDLYEKGMVQ